MKLLKVFVLLSFIILSNGAQGQEAVFGNWYTPVGNKLLKIKISKDSLVIEKQSFDLKIKDTYKDSGKLKVEKVIVANENDCFIVSEKKDAIVLYKLFAFKVSKPKKEMKMAVESYDKPYKSVVEAEGAIKEGEFSGNEITLLSENQILEIQKLKDISKMTTTAFNLFAEECIKRRAEISQKLKGQNFKLNSVFLESTTKLIFVTLGYNPLVKKNVFDDLMDGFATNPETKVMFEKLIPNGK